MRLVLVPCLNEEDTIERTCRFLLRAVRLGAIDRFVILDSGSDDGSVRRALAAGAPVLAELPHEHDGPVLGKGDVIWRGLCHLRRRGDLTEDMRVGFLDADLKRLDGGSLERLMSTASTTPHEILRKAAFDRLDTTGRPRALNGGRVTELVARPLLSLLAAPSSGLRQPLSGQISIEARHLLDMPLLTGYALEIGMVLEVERRFGAGSVVEVPWKPVINRMKTDQQLMPVAEDVLAGALLMLGHEVASQRVVVRPPVSELVG